MQNIERPNIDRVDSNGPRPLRVLHFISEPRSWHFFDGQPDFLRGVGCEFIGVSSPGPLLGQFAETNRVTVYPVKVVRGLSIIGDIVSSFRLCRVLRKVRPDILHAHFSKPGIIGMVSGFVSRVPVRIYHNHGMALSSARGWKRLLLWAVERVSCTLAHRIIYVAPSVLRDAIRMRVCNANKAVAILSANGLDSSTRFTRERFTPDSRVLQRRLLQIPPEAFVIGFVGRILNIKGIEELVRAWEILSPTEPRLHLLFVGESDLRAPISARVESLMHLESKIHLAGFIEDPAIAYLAMDVVVLPSYHEGLGYSLIEAAAMKLPVIGTRIPGIVDAVLDGKSGTLVQPGNPEELAAAILKYLHDPCLSEAHGKAGREFVLSSFKRSDVWERIRHLYVELIIDRNVSVSSLDSRSQAKTTPGDMGTGPNMRQRGTSSR